MVGRSTVRNRHHGNKPCASVAPSPNTATRNDDKPRRTEECGMTVSIHPIWPEMPSGQGELFFECTLFLYSVLALFLQYLNLYKTLWWLPKSYWHYSMKFHLINPYLLSCVGLLLGLRVTKCFWNTISELAANASNGATGAQLIFWRIIEYAAVKTPLSTMVTTSFLFSFSRVYHDYPLRSLLYFGHPIIFFFFIFYNEIVYKVCRLLSIIRFIVAGGSLCEISSAPMLYTNKLAPPSLVDVDSVVHMCSTNPGQIREEVGVLIRDFSLRIKHCIFSGLSTAYLSIFIPCVFTPQRSPSGIPQQLYIDVLWVIEMFCIVFMTSFSLYVTYLLPIQYCELIHRSAAHLGKWERIDNRQSSGTSQSINAAAVQALYQNWSENELYADGAVVRHQGRTYRAVANPETPGVAAEPGDIDHDRFYRMGVDPVNLLNAMALCQVVLIGLQFWMLVLTIEWQHIVTLIMLIFANYLLLAKVFKDRIVIGRIHKPSPEDIQLLKQMQQEAAS